MISSFENGIRFLTIKLSRKAYSEIYPKPEKSNEA